MSNADENYTGIWLHEGERRGQAFSHNEARYYHPSAGQLDQPPAAGAGRMKHVFIERDGSQLGVWVPESWSEEEARTALETNW